MTSDSNEDRIMERFNEIMADFDKHPYARLMERNVALEARIRELEAELERLRVANIQMQFALGYPMPAEMEHYIIPSNPWKCGMCEARYRAAQPGTSD